MPVLNHFQYLNPIQNARMVLSCRSLYYVLHMDTACNHYTLPVDCYRRTPYMDNANNNPASDICIACIAYLSFPTPSRILIKLSCRFLNKFALALCLVETIIAAHNPPPFTGSPYTSKIAIATWTRRQFNIFQFFISHFSSSLFLFLRIF